MLYPKDSKLTVRKREESLQIEWSWNRRTGYLALLAAIVFSILIFVISNEPTKPGLPRSESNVRELWVLGGIYIVGFVGVAITNIFNRTEIVATKDAIECHAHPFTLSKRNQFAMDGVQQFFVRPSKTGNFSGWLYVMDKNSECTLLTYRMPSTFAAFQICHELQDFYGLEDLPVYGQNTQPHQPGPRNKQYE